MRKARQKVVIAAAQQLNPLLLRASERGAAALGLMTDSEWEQLAGSVNDGT